jgi:hypothetical protein
VPAAATVISQLRVGATTNEHKAAMRLLGFLPIRDKVVTADAMFTHRDFAQAVRDGGASMSWSPKTITRNCQSRSGPRSTTRRTFRPCQLRQKRAQGQTAQTTDKGHGRTEARRLTSTTSLNAHLDWPEVGQVCELERVRQTGAKSEVEVV